MPFINVKKFGWDKPKHCTHPEHNPPSHIVLEPGIYTWKCPRCCKEQTFTVPEKPTL
jgi:hypothetical protein